MVSTSVCEVASPSRLFCYSSYSPSINISTCLVLDPIPALCNLFISTSSVALKLLSEKVNGMLSVWPQVMQQMWWSMFGTNSLPSSFCTSSTKHVSQCCSSHWLSSVKSGMESPRVSGRYLFIGVCNTWCLLWSYSVFLFAQALCISYSVFGVANVWDSLVGTSVIWWVELVSSTSPWFCDSL